MQRSSLLLLIAASVGLAACSMDNPAEVRDDAHEFPVIATWSAAAAPVSPATESGALTIQQHLGFRMDASFTITGTPSSPIECASSRSAAFADPSLGSASARKTRAYICP